MKRNKLAYKDNKLSYKSEAGQTFEYWGKSKTVPRIDGKEIDYNPAKAYSSPYLSMVHNEEKAVISYPGYDDVVLDFSLDKNKKRPVLLASYSGEVVDFLPQAYWTLGDPLKIKIIKATYGFGPARLDVTETLAEMVATDKNYGGKLYVDDALYVKLGVQNTRLVDDKGKGLVDVISLYNSINSSPQSQRDLIVTYEIDGKQKTKTTKEIKRGGWLVFD